MRLMTLTLLIALTLPARAGDYIAVHATGWVDAVPDMLTLSVAAQAAGKDSAFTWARSFDGR